MSKRPRSRFSFLFLLILLVGFAVYTYQQQQQIQRSIANIEQSMGGVIDETGKKLKIVDQIEAFGGDLNEIRRFLYLPTKDYSFASMNEVAEDDSDTETGSGSQIAPLLFQYIDKVGAEKKKKESLVALKQQFENVFQDEKLRADAGEQGVSFGPLKDENGLYLIESLLGKNSLSRFEVNQNSGQYAINDFRGKQEFATIADFQTGLSSYVSQLTGILELKNKSDAIEKEIEVVMKDKEIVAVLGAKKISYARPNIVNKENQTILSVKADAVHTQFLVQIGSNTSSYTDKELFQQGLLTSLQTIDTRSEIEKLLEQRKLELESVFADAAFKDVLAGQQLQIQSTPLDETDRIYYYLSDLNNVRVGAIVIEKGTAEVMVVDAQGANAVSLEDFLTTTGSKKKP